MSLATIEFFFFIKRINIEQILKITLQMHTNRVLIKPIQILINNAQVEAEDICV